MHCSSGANPARPLAPHVHRLFVEMAHEGSSEARPRAVASAGKGPLLQRDYWALIDRCSLAPPRFGELLSRRFCELAPHGLVHFARTDGTTRPLEVGDELDVHIRFAGTYGVRVVHRDDHSITLGTLKGHPEAGRITFGAYRHERGDVIFHIRSRARASSRTRYGEWLALGEPMQTKTWTDFVARVASFTGRGVVDFVYEESARCDDEHDEQRPTFRATGD